MRTVTVYGKEGLRAFGLVDDEDYALASSFRWNLRDQYVISRGRPRTRGGRRPLVNLHRLILGLANDDPREGHHVNGDKLDNRRQNLEALTVAEHVATRTKTRSIA